MSPYNTYFYCTFMDLGKRCTNQRCTTFGEQCLEHTTTGAQNQWSTESLGAQAFGAQPLEHRTIGAQGYLEHKASQIIFGLWIYTFSMIERTTYSQHWVLRLWVILWLYPVGIITTQL